MISKITAVLAGISLACAATEFHVATDGSDSNTGSADNPLRTIQAAVNKMQPGDECIVNQGVYHETVTIRTDGVKLTARGTVILSAADPVTGWTVDKDKIWKAPVTGALGVDEGQVFVRGKWYPQARFPNVDDWVLKNCDGRQRPNRCGDIEGFARPWSAVQLDKPSIMAPAYMPGWMDNLKEDVHDGWPTTPGMCRIGINGFGEELTSPADNPYNILYGKPRDHWKGCLVWCQGWWWSASGYVSASYDGTNQYLGSPATFFEVATPRIRWSGSFVFIGHYDFIDKPGEWVVRNDTLYMWIPDGIAPESGDILLRKRIHTFDLKARQNIRITGFHTIGGQPQMDTASGCTFDSCHFYALNHGWLIYYGDTVPGFETAGKYGILFNGSNNTFENGSVVYAMHSAFVFRNGKINKVINSYITDIDYANTYAAPILMQQKPSNSEITRNTFMRVGRSILGGFASAILKYNKLCDAMMLSGDGGTLYSVMGGLTDASDSEIGYNWFKGCYGEPSTYIYTDWGCALGMRVHHNVFFETAAEGKFIPEATCGMHYFNNTWLAPVRDREWLFAVKDSVYEDSAWGKREWANNLNAAYDKAFWQFTDTTNGDFTLTAASPAVDSGVVIPNFTDAEGGYSGAAPDLGAYEYGKPAWIPGHTWGMPVIEEELWARVKGEIAVGRQAGRGASLPVVAFIRTRGGLQVRFSQTVDAVVLVHNALGRTVMRVARRQCAGMHFGLAGLPAGIYSIKVSTDMGASLAGRTVIPF